MNNLQQYEISQYVILSCINKMNILLKLQNKPLFKKANIKQYNYNFLLNYKSIIYDYYYNNHDINFIFYNTIIINKQNLYINIPECKNENINNYLIFLNIDFYFKSSNELYIFNILYNINDSNINDFNINDFSIILKIINYICNLFI